jgi:hypothetical protein
MVSNLQLNPGLYATAATPLLALVNNQTDIVADFREKSLRHTGVNTDAAVVFDALPGKVFPAHVTSSDAGILAGQEAVNGQLSQPEQSTRWVRDAQRMRIHVALDEPLDKPLPTGARATVQLYNSEGPFARTFAGLQIHLVSCCTMSINTLARVFTPHGNIVYTANDFRQTLRIAVAGMIALSISTFYDVQYGVFFVVYPLMLLSLVPVFNRHVARQFVFSAAVNCVEMVLIVGYLSQWPVIMTLVVFGLYVMRFRFMSQGPLFLLGSMGVVCQSTMLNFMSYPTSNWHTLMFSNMEACVMAVALSALLNYLIPDVEPRKPPPRIEKDAARIRHESLLSGTVATMIFVVFQICDLSDSLSALMAGF